MIDEGILAKEARLIALYGVNAQQSPFLRMLNDGFKKLGLNDFAIGLNIKPEDFSYMVKGMPQSKVQMALYEPEYQEEVVPLLDSADACTAVSGLCDGARAAESKLAGECFYPESFERMCVCEGVALKDARVLMLGGGAAARALLPLLGVAEAAFVEVADTAVERAAEALEAAKASLIGVETDVSWYQPGMEADASKYDLMINAIDLYAHEGRRILNLTGEGSHLTLIDFVRGQSAFDILAKESECRKLGGREWMAAQTVSIAKRWLGAQIDCDSYQIVKS